MGWRKEMLFMPESDPIDLAPFFPTAAPLAVSFAEGRLDMAETPYLYAARDRRLADGGETLMIGSAGVDGIEFALRRGLPGVWVFFPYRVEWQRLAADIATFEADWLSDQITF